MKKVKVKKFFFHMTEDQMKKNIQNLQRSLVHLKETRPVEDETNVNIISLEAEDLFEGK